MRLMSYMHIDKHTVNRCLSYILYEAAMWLRLLWTYKGAAVHGHLLGPTGNDPLKHRCLQLYYVGWHDEYP